VTIHSKGDNEDEKNINNPSEYYLTFRARSTTYRNFNYLKIYFTKESKLTLDQVSGVIATDYSGTFDSTLGKITNQVGRDDIGDFVILENAVEYSVEHRLTLFPVINPPVAAFVEEPIMCQSCREVYCGYIFETDYTNSLQFVANELIASAVTITSSSPITGATDVTLSIVIELANKVIKEGSVYLEIPKRNVKNKALSQSYPDSFW